MIASLLLPTAAAKQPGDALTYATAPPPPHPLPLALLPPAGTSDSHHRPRAALPVGLPLQDCTAGQPGGPESQVSVDSAPALLGCAGRLNGVGWLVERQATACNPTTAHPLRPVCLPAGTGSPTPKPRSGSCGSSWRSSSSRRRSRAEGPAERDAARRAPRQQMPACCLPCRCCQCQYQHSFATL